MEFLNYCLPLVLLISATAGGYLLIPDPLDGECPGTGPRCTSDCKDIILCLTTTTTPMHVATCPDNKFCKVENDGAPNCSALFCGAEPFRCTMPGAVPNPSNSSSYYLCGGVNTNGFLTNCPAGKYFNTATLTCDADQPIDPVSCKDFAASGEIGTDHVFCYICDEQYLPIVFKCSLKNSTEDSFSLFLLP